jgi:hypothetical protein
MEIFGFTIKRKVQSPPSPIPKEVEDGSMVVSEGGAYGTYIDLDGTVRSDTELINKYREIAQVPEVEAAIDEISNEAIINDPHEPTVKINLAKLNIDPKIKNIIEQEFNYILEIMKFDTYAWETFRRWYIDGRIFYQLLTGKNPNEGLVEIRYIDPRKIRRVTEVKKKKLPGSNVMEQEEQKEYYLYNEKGFLKSAVAMQTTSPYDTKAIKISIDSVVDINSGLTTTDSKTILSYLHKAIKPVNQLRSLEDSMVIYRISRAPERRVFYIDVGNLPKMKAEQYLKDIMTKFKNRVVYDASTGEVRDDRKFMTMLEDFWLPRREGGRGTEITTLPGGQNLGEIEDIMYFRKKLFNALNVPLTRLEPSEGSYTLGRATEITRDEIKFTKFINRLRSRFSQIFMKILEKQLVLKGIVAPEEWKYLSNYIKFVYSHDNYYAELKEAEILRERLAILNEIDPYVGKYYSLQWIKTNVLRQTETDMEEIMAQVQQEIPLLTQLAQAHNPEQPPE